jgi:hypothetical protein
VIEILERWHELVTRKACESIPEAGEVFYVGKTGLWVDERYRQHRQGKKSGRVFKWIRKDLFGAEQDLPVELEDGIDVLLRPDLMPPEANLSETEVRKLEVKVAQDLRAQGHLVFQN